MGFNRYYTHTFLTAYASILTQDKQDKCNGAGINGCFNEFEMNNRQ